MDYFQDIATAEEVSGRWSEDERQRNRAVYVLPSTESICNLYRRCGLAACVARWGHLYSSRAIFDFATGRAKPQGHGWRSGKRRASMSFQMCEAI